jgi:hypothetical protein
MTAGENKIAFDWKAAVSKFRLTDLSRALKGAMAAGAEIAAVEIEPSGKIVIQFVRGDRVEPSNDLDKWMAEHANKT